MNWSAPWTTFSCILFQDQGDTPQNLYVPVGLCSSRDLSTTLLPDIFSHLPLHSQGQVPTPVSMIPIGGIRMPSTSISGAAGERNTLPSIPQGKILETASSGRTSAPVLDPGVACSGEIATSSTGLHSKDDKKEESVYICAKAIASLRITSEDAVDKPPKSWLCKHCIIAFKSKTKPKLRPETYFMQGFKHSEWLCWTYLTCVLVLHWRFFCTQGAIELPLSVCAIKLDVLLFR